MFHILRKLFRRLYKSVLLASREPLPSRQRRLYCVAWNSNASHSFIDCFSRHATYCTYASEILAAQVMRDCLPYCIGRVCAHVKHDDHLRSPKNCTNFCKPTMQRPDYFRTDVHVPCPKKSVLQVAAQMGRKLVNVLQLLLSIPLSLSTHDETHSCQTLSHSTESWHALCRVGRQCHRAL